MLAVVLLAPQLAGTAQAQTTRASVERVRGSDRIATAVEVSRRFFADGAERVVLATAARFPDALAAGPLARALDAPILLTRTGALEPSVRAELGRLGATEVVLVGGEDALSPAVHDELDEAGYRVRRVSGPDRYATAAAIAAELDRSDHPLVARGEGDDGFADALSAGTFGRGDLLHPTLLTRPEGLPSVTAGALRSILPRSLTVLGGTAAVSEPTFDAIRSLVPGATRLGGADRYTTAVNLAIAAEAEHGIASTIVVATGQRFPDSLVAGALTANLDAPVLLVPTWVPGDGTPGERLAAAVPALADFLRDRCPAIDRAVVLGGDAVVPHVVSLRHGRAIEDILDADLIPALTGTSHSDTVPAGRVISQNPAGSTEVAPGTPVGVVLSLGPELQPVPDVVGMTEAAAVAAVEAAGFTVGSRTGTTSDEVDPGQVATQLPLAGTMALPGSPVDVAIATGSVNDPPVIVSEPPTEAVAGVVWSYQGEAEDPDGDPLSWVLQGGPDGASVDSATGLVTWTPGADDDGPHDVALRVEDGRGGVDVQSWTVTVPRDNVPPTAFDDIYEAVVGEELTVDAMAGVLVNDDDPDGDELTAVLVEGPTNGTLGLSPDGSFTYLPRTATSATRIYTEIDLTRLSGAVATVEHIYNGYEPDRLVDGFLGAGWYDRTWQNDGRITITFPHPVRVTDLKLWGNRDGYQSQSYGVEEVEFTFEDGDGEVLHETGSVELPPQDPAVDADRDLELEIPGGVEGVRVIELHVLRTEGFYPGIGELQVFGDGPIVSLGPSLEWHWGPNVEVRMTPTVGDLDADGMPELLFISYYSTTEPYEVLHVWSGDGSGERWSVPDVNRDNMAPVIADLDGEPGMEVAVLRSDARTVSIHRGDTGEQVASYLLPYSAGDTNMAIADLDGDGRPEIVIGGSSRIMAVHLDDDGNLVQFRQPSAQEGCGVRYSPGCVPIVSDIDLDGRPEIIAGRTIYSWDLQSWRHLPGPTANSTSAVANFDSDPYAEIVVVGVGQVWLFDHDGGVIWGPVPIPAAPSKSAGTGGAPTVADFDGDGRPEIGIAGASMYVVFDTDGSILWATEVQDASSHVTGSTVFDFDQDGRAEVVYRDEYELLIFDGPTGEIRFRTTVGSGTYNEMPVVADIDADGQAEIVTTSDRRRTLPDGTSSDFGVYVFGPPTDRHGVPLDNWSRARTIWNQHSYHVTNIAPDGTVPAVEQPNWLIPTLNNFRQNSFPPDELDRADRFTYVASDGVAQSAPATVYLDLLPPANAPRLTCLPAQVATEGLPYHSRICAHDPDDDDEVTFSIEADDPAPQVDPLTGIVTWTAPEGSVGEHSWLIVATDATGRTTAQPLVITVEEPVEVPELVGLEEAEATDALDDAGLSVGAVVSRFDPEVPAGRVLAATPPPGAAVAPGRRIDLVVSLGPEPEPVVDDSDLDAAFEEDGVELDGILLNPVNPTLLVGRTLPMNARAYYLPDGRNRDVTDAASWSTDDPSVATVTDGVLTAVGPGTTQVTVTLDGISASRTVRVLGAEVTDRNPPVARVDSPAEHTVVTEPLDVVATVEDDHLVGWSLALVGEDGGAVATVAEGADPVSSGVVGTLDPTRLLNGSFTLVLRAWDQGGNETVSRVGITIDGALKVGTFTLDFVDLLLPVSGLPVQVLRHYDTRDDSVGDFGYGWRLGFNSLRLTTTGVQGLGWEAVGGGWSHGVQPTTAHRVSLTLPDGRTETFEAALSPSTSSLVPLSSTRVRYLPADLRTQGRLEVVGNTQVLVVGGGGSEVELVDDLTFRTFDPTRFRYIAPDGTAYVIDRGGDVRSITDRNGNTVTISAAGITHSAGRSVAFERDELGRITAIEGPDGVRQTYAYDSRGDLVRHTDAEGNVTRFRYTGEHDLLEIIDPLGRVVDRREYDDDGRLIAVTDGTGNRLELEHDLGDRTEVIVDPRGYRTVITYDERGNVLTARDHLGGELTNTYDANGNRVSSTDPLGRKTTWTYDAAGRVLSESNDEGETTTRTYDAAGRVTSVTTPLGTTTFAYDSRGNLIEAVRPDGATTRSSYDSRGNLVTLTAPDGRTTTYTYDASGLPTGETRPDGSTITLELAPNGGVETLTSALGVVTEFELDAYGAPTAFETPDGSRWEIEYTPAGALRALVAPGGLRTEQELDAAGRITSLTDAAGGETRYTYTPTGKVATAIEPGGAVTTYTYDELDRPVRVERGDDVTLVRYDAAGQVVGVDEGDGETTYTYDGAGRVLTVTDPTGRTTTHTYENGLLVATTDPAGVATHFEYDPAGRLTATVLPDDTRLTSVYDDEGRVVARTDRAGRTTTFAYDAAGNLVEVVDARGARTYATYDAEGRLLSVTDANGHTRRFVHDANGRVVQRIDAVGAVETIEYDELGNPVRVTDANGDVTETEFDAAGRRTRIDLADGRSLTFTYSPDGRIVRVADERGTTEYELDEEGRLVGIDLPDGASLAYGYGDAGLLAWVDATVPDGTTRRTSYGWDAAGRLTSVADGTGRTTTFQYDPAGRVERVGRPGGVTTTYAYDQLGRVTGLTHARGATVLESLNYQRDANGDVTRIEDADGVISTFAYDELRRLVAETHADGGDVLTERTYTYDAVGNRLTEVVDGTTTTYTYDAADRLLAAGATRFSYDAVGNLVSVDDGTDAVLYGYDPLGRLNAAITTHGATTYEHDHSGSRVRAGDERHLVDPLALSGVPEVVASYDASGGATAWYTHGPSLLSQEQGGALSVVLPDSLGSTRALTDATGSVTDTMRYLAFGEQLDRTGTTPVRHLFAGQQLDAETGLYHLRARQYDPATGRLTAVDAHPGSVEDPVTRHPYQYARNNPLSYVDPTGHMAMPTLAEIGVAAALQGTIGAIVGGTVSAVTGGSFLRGALFGALTGAAGAFLSAGISMGVAAVALRTAGAQTLQSLAAAGIIDLAIFVARGIGDATFSLLTDGRPNGAVEILLTLTISILLEVSFSSPKLATELSQAARRMLDSTAEGLSRTQRTILRNLQQPTELGRIVWTDHLEAQILEMAGVKGLLSNTLSSAGQKWAVAARQADIIGGWYVEAIKKWAGLVPGVVASTQSS